MWFVVCNYGNVRPEIAMPAPPQLHKTLPLQEKAAAARRFHRLPRPVWKGLCARRGGRQGRFAAAAFSRVGGVLCSWGGARVAVSAIPRGT